MANIDITQLETNEEIEETGARNGADAELIAITSRKKRNVAQIAAMNFW